MTVWIVNPFDNLPLEGYRPQRYWLMARGFASAGHKVVYWTSDFSHATKRKRALVRQQDDGFAVRLVPSMPYPANVCLRRLASHWLLARSWKRMAEREAEKPDVIVASTPPLSLCHAALRFAKRHKAFFVADIMDAWPETFERIAPSWLLFPMRRIARSIYTQADAISTVASRYSDLATGYGTKAPLHCCNHGIEMKEDGSGQRTEKGDGLRLVYVGSMGMSYDLETVIDAVRQMEETTLNIAGGGPKEAALRERTSGCTRISFHGYLGDEELRALLESSSIGIIPMFPNSCVGIPYKLADYAASGLKIVESLGGETGELVAKYHAGCHYEANNVDSLKMAIVSAGSIKEPNPPAFPEHFDAVRIMSEYVKWVENEV